MAKGLNDRQNECARRLIKELMESGKYKFQADLARDLGLEQGAVSRLLLGRGAGTSLEILQRAARLADEDYTDAIGVTAADIRRALRTRYSNVELAQLVLSIEGYRDDLIADAAKAAIFDLGGKQALSVGAWRAEILSRLRRDSTRFRAATTA